ncbi:MAG: hypothetical protein ABJN14_11400 [Paracoccaceae bacterium]
MTQSVTVSEKSNDLRRFLLMGLVMISALILAACSRSDAVTFDGQVYRAKLSKVDRQLIEFSVEVSPVSASFEGALEAGRFEATRHCIENFGTSVIDWETGPDDDPETLAVVKDTLSFQGSCRF